MFGDECLGSLFKLNASESRGRGHGAWEGAMQLYKQGSKPPKPPKVTRHQPNTRPHELKLEYLKTRLGLSGLPLPLLILNHGRRKGAYQNNIPQTLDPTLPVMVEQAIVQG
jgi:hypothetical protein